jgi:hypothetical protein
MALSLTIMLLRRWQLMMDLVSDEKIVVKEKA